MVKTSPILVLELKVCNTKKIVNPMEKKKNGTKGSLTLKICLN
jgi:hypothetical protein